MEEGNFDGGHMFQGLNSKRSVEFWLHEMNYPIMFSGSANVTSHRNVHTKRYDILAGETGPSDVRIIVERTDANKRLFFRYTKINFPPDFIWDETILYTFVRELKITNNKKDLLPDSKVDKTSERPGFIAECIEERYRLTFGNFLYQNEKVCEIGEIEENDEYKKFRISFDHLNRNLVVNNEDTMMSKRPNGEFVIVLENKKYVCISSFCYKHFSGKGTDSRWDQSAYKDYDCTSYLIKKDKEDLPLILGTFQRGIARVIPRGNLNWSMLQNNVDSSRYNNIHIPQRQTPVTFNGGGKKRKKKVKKKRTGKKRKREDRDDKKYDDDDDEEEEEEEDMSPPGKKRKL